MQYHTVTATAGRFLTTGCGSGTARRMMEMRLRVEITAREAAQPSDPRIEEARQELHALTGVTRDTD